MLKGIGTSNGIGFGKALVIVTADIEPDVYQIEDIDGEKEKFKSLRSNFIEDTEKLVDELSEKLGKDDKNTLVLKNQIYLAKDVTFEQSVLDNIRDNRICAEAAIDSACNTLIQIFSTMDNETMNQRVADIKDMRLRMLEISKGIKHRDLSHLLENTVIVADEIHPSMTAGLDAEHVTGIVASRGGETSHASILARAMGIPAVLSIKNATDSISDGDDVIVDGAYGEVFVNPAQATVNIYKKKKASFEEQCEELKKYIERNTQSADGRSYMIAANVGGASDVVAALNNGAEGVGLFRTEFLFMNGISLPSEEVQFEEYRKVAVLLKGKAVTIRTLDVGGDKNIPYMGLSRETNPFLGYRAIRYCLGRVDVFTTQLKAILRASAYGNIRIMLPMITSVNEVLQAKKLISSIKKNFDRNGIAYEHDIKIGIMVETPAAAVMADVLAKEVDFFSIGTNDLTQYVIAVDRCNENVSYLYSPYNPAVLRLIKNVIEAGHREHIEVAMCGEAAGHEEMIPLLMAYGLDEFSVSPSKILETRKNIASWSVKEAEHIETMVADMNSDKQVSDYLSDYISAKIKK